MRVLLVSGNREDIQIRVPALGLACIATATERAGHDVRMLDLMAATDPQSSVIQAIEDFNPQIIGVSVRNIDDQRMSGTRFLLEQARETVAWCRKASGSPIVLGGAGFSILPGPVLDYVDADMGVQGEGEVVFPELLRRLEEAGVSLNGLPNFYERGRASTPRRSFPKDLDALPLPDPSLLAAALAGAHDAPVPVQTRRGCPLSCSYCSTPTIEGKSVRRRSPETVVAWMSRWVEEGFRDFYFVDNTFNLPPSYSASLCSKIAASGMDISWRCILFPGGIDGRLIEMLAQAGCKEVSLGFESGSTRMLNGMKKSYTLQEVRNAADLLRRNHIRAMGFLLLGGPGETRESVRESLAFAESLDLDSLKITIGVRIYPHTEVALQAAREGLITGEQDLLFPRFYVAKGLENWLQETVLNCLSNKDNWTV
ncbi:MAG: radical SAM protein [Acidobacteria bacterium]|nr:radical SAM protein [Acidobacteriota bacterium]